MKVVRKSTLIVSHILLGLGAVVMLYPFVFAFLGMFVSIDGFYRVQLLPIPEGFGYCFENIKLLAGRYKELFGSFFLTLARFVWYAAILGFTSVLGGYAFAKVNFRFKKVAFYLLMSSMMIPGIALLIPQYMMLNQFPLVGGNDIFGKGGAGFRDNPAVLFLLGCFSAYNIFLVRQTLAGIGNEYKEAAEIDGAGFFRIVFTIYMPMLTPVLALMTIQTFIGQWNDYLFPLLFLPSTRNLWPMGVLSVKLQADYLYSAGLMNYPMVMLIAILMVIPPVAVYIAFQKYFVEGLTLGGVKS